MVQVIWNRQVAGDAWPQMRWEIARHWPRLKSSDLDEIAGNRSRLVRALQTRYGFMADEALREVAEWQESGVQPQARQSPRRERQEPRFSYEQPDHPEPLSADRIEPPPESDRSMPPEVEEPVERPDVIEEETPPETPTSVELGEPVETSPPIATRKRHRPTKRARRNRK